MVKSTSRTIRVGIFVVIGTILLIAALYFIGKQKFIFSDNIELYAVFENVNGLQVGNNVRYSGINIGTVSNIEMTEVGMITVKMSVEQKTASFIKKDAIASIASDGLVGSMVLNITPGKNQKEKVVASGDTIQSYSKIGADDMLTTLNTTNENAALLTADLLKITNKILEGKGTIGVLVNDTTLAQDIRQVVLEISRASKETGMAISRVNRIISKINYDESAAAVILSDTASANKIRQIFTNLEKSSDDINDVTKNLNSYLDEIKSSKGTLNLITQDEKLAREIDSTMISIKEASDKLNQNMEALKHNILFRGYFKKAEKKAAKKK